MNLKPRLQLITKKVSNCNLLCDIGTDHAYIPIYLAQNKICRNIIAADLKPGPLKIAQKNIKLFNLENIIKTRLSNGFSNIFEKELNISIIAGMGGILITKILSNELDKVKNIKTLILQPMNTIEILRKWLYNNGFYIVDEELVLEEDKIYTVIVTSYIGIAMQKKNIYYHIGEKLIEKKDKLLKLYINKKIDKLETAIYELIKSKNKSNTIQSEYIQLKSDLVHILSSIF